MRGTLGRARGRGEENLVPLLLGLVEHLGFVEQGWFCATSGWPTRDLPDVDADPEADRRAEPGETAADVVRELLDGSTGDHRGVTALPSWADGLDLEPHPEGGW